MAFFQGTAGQDTITINNSESNYIYGYVAANPNNDDDDIITGANWYDAILDPYGGDYIWRQRK